jgi:hypothetical protein
MKTKQIISVAVAAICSMTVCSYAQDAKSTMALLTGHDWEMAVSSELSAIERYDNSANTCNFYSSGKLIGTLTGRYYLSGEVEGRFDESKVGTVSHGKYIILKTGDKVTVYQILKLDEKELITKTISDQIMLGDGMAKRKAIQKH